MPDATTAPPGSGPPNPIRDLIHRFKSGKIFPTGHPVYYRVPAGCGDGWIQFICLHEHIAAIVSDVTIHTGHTGIPGQASSRKIIVLRHDLAAGAPAGTAPQTLRLQSFDREAFGQAATGKPVRQLLLLITVEGLQMLLPDLAGRHEKIRNALLSGRKFSLTYALTTEQYGLILRFLDLSAWTVFTPARMYRIHSDSIELILMAFRRLPDRPQQKKTAPADQSLVSLAESIVACIRQNQALPSTDQAAQLCHMSSSKFRRVFKKYTGETYHGYCLREKIRFIRELTATHQLDLNEAIRRTGYSNLPFVRKKYLSLVKKLDKEARNL